MAKRGATREINHDNWDQEDDTEEAGVFKQADEDALKGRQIRKAKRRTAADGGESASGTLGAFKGFTGFTSINTKTSTFSFNKDSSTPLSSLANGSSGAATLFGGFKSNVGTEAKSSFSFLSQAASNTDSTKPASPKKTELEKSSPVPTTNGTGKTGSRTKYLQSLKALNESVSKWIMQHVDKNAHCILTPIFKDYERHLADIEKLNPDKECSASNEQEESSTSAPVRKEPTYTTSAGAVGTTSASALATVPTATFKFTPSGPSSTSSTVSTTPLFGGATGGFTLGPRPAGESKTTPFSFATGATSSSSSSTQGEQADEEYVPPETEVTEVKEGDAFYSKRCKLYYQKDGAWVEKGLGNLHLKACGEKTQMIIRADTNLGNILLNIMLSSSLPMSRQGKNNVSMMCVPNPPLDPKLEASKPVGMLLKVKTAEDADELFKNLEESKK